MSVKPEMASPTFAVPTYTFSPTKWPAVEDSGYAAERFSADAQTSAGEFIRHSSPVNERLIIISYRLLSTIDRDAMSAPGGTGFFHDVGGSAFEYKDDDGSIYTVRFQSSRIEWRPAGVGRWNCGPVIMVVT